MAASGVDENVANVSRQAADRFSIVFRERCRGLRLPGRVGAGEERLQRRAGVSAERLAGLGADSLERDLPGPPTGVIQPDRVKNVTSQRQVLRPKSRFEVVGVVQCPLGRSL